jgi:hypothetical protein
MRYLGIVFLIVAVLAIAADAALAQTPRPVNLTNSSYPPDFLEYVQPGERSSDVPKCTSDVSAYRWNGRALGAQHSNTMGDRIVWNGQRGRAVYDGMSFENRTHRPVLVAAWCG